jgi:hypothetical protein
VPIRHFPIWPTKCSFLGRFSAAGALLVQAEFVAIAQQHPALFGAELLVLAVAGRSLFAAGSLPERIARLRFLRDWLCCHIGFLALVVHLLSRQEAHFLGGRLSVGFCLPTSFRGHISRYRGLEFLPVLIPEAFPFGVAFDSGIECFCDHMTDCRWILFVQVRAVSDELCIDVRAQPNAVGCDWRLIFRC